MDHELEARWRSGRAPFDQAILRCEMIPLSVLQPTVQALVPVLMLPELRLYAFDDWHEHDGYVTQASAVAWSNLDEIVATEASLFDARHRDTYVRRAFYPESAEWLFRLCVLEPNEDEQYPGIWGTFDLSGTSSLCAGALSAIGGESSATLGDAKAYFDEHYAG
jgi:hypothetical protein